MRRLTLMASVSLLVTAVHAETLQPVEVSQADAEGPVFERPGAIVKDDGNRAFKDFVMLESPDKVFQSGIFESAGGTFDSDGYRHDEFMYFIKGGVTLTSEDGTVTEIEAGDAVTIPKGWKGRWASDGYTKFYVIYEPAEE